jgi:ribose transport system ATP-binding protein
MEKQVVLEALGITKRFPGTIALSNVDIRVKEGEVHALVGENGAGKSTLMNIISGVLQPDEGEIFMQGDKMVFSNPREAQKAGIGFVHQELALCQHISVAENIYMGRVPEKGLSLIDFDKLYADTDHYLKMFKCKISPDAKTGDLNVAEQQVLEIAKALSLNCKLLILDEPTSSLTDSETETLFEIIRDLKKKGVSVLYISHRMSEIFTICDAVTVLRDGSYIKTVTIENTNPHEIVCSMVGREVNNLYPEKRSSGSEKILEVKNFCKKGVFEDISFSVEKGEILGFSGLIGAGRTEIMKAVCGIDKEDSGELIYKGSSLQIKNYGQAIEHGICYLTEDRKKDGLFLNMSIQDNVTAAVIEDLASQGIISNTKEVSLAEHYVKNLNVKAGDVNRSVKTLSGGNQQKVVIAKWLSAKPQVLIMDEPTRGIDVGAKYEIHSMLRELANNGMAIIIISSELPEIIGMCDRVVVMHEGKITGVLKEQELDEKTIMLLASNQ